MARTSWCRGPEVDSVLRSSSPPRDPFPLLRDEEMQRPRLERCRRSRTGPGQRSTFNASVVAAPSPRSRPGTPRRSLRIHLLRKLRCPRRRPHETRPDRIHRFRPCFSRLCPGGVQPGAARAAAGEPGGVRNPGSRTGRVQGHVSPARRKQAKSLGRARALRRRVARRGEREHDAHRIDAVHVRRQAVPAARTASTCCRRKANGRCF